MLISFNLTTNHVCSWFVIQCGSLKVTQVFVKKGVSLIALGDFENNIKTRKICVYISLQLKQY